MLLLRILWTLVRIRYLYLQEHQVTRNRIFSKLTQGKQLFRDKMNCQFTEKFTKQQKNIALQNYKLKTLFLQKRPSHSMPQDTAYRTTQILTVYRRIHGIYKF